MTVEELILKLRELPQDAHVYWPLRSNAGIKDEADPVDEIEIGKIWAHNEKCEYQENLLLRVKFFSPERVESIQNYRAQSGMALMETKTIVVIH